MAFAIEPIQIFRLETQTQFNFHAWDGYQIKKHISVIKLNLFSFTLFFLNIWFICMKIVFSYS